MRKLLLGSLLAASVVAGSMGARASSGGAPVITEPAVDGQIISPFDVHMVAAALPEAPGELHTCSDWEIRTSVGDLLAWSAPCVAGAGRVHVHLGDGRFSGPSEGQHQLISSGHYRLRVRFLAGADAEAALWSAWAERPFVTTAATVIQPLVLSDVSVVPPPRWRDEAGADLVLPEAAGAVASLRLDVRGGGTALTFLGLDGASHRVVNAVPLAAHGALRAVVTAGAAVVELPASRLDFTDGSGQDRQVHLPAISLTPGELASFWISESGGAFTDASNGATEAVPDFSAPVTEPPVPWAVKQPGFRVDRVATGLQLPVNIAFVPSPGSAPDDPFFYVAELYGSVQVVTRDGRVSAYATNLLNFDPLGGFPGSGEQGLAGLAVEPATGDLIVSSIYALPGVADYHFPEVRRLHSDDGGRRVATQAAILQAPEEPMGASHQTSSVSVGPDGKLYVHVGDGLLTSPAQDLGSLRGKILRLNPDGTAPGDNPFYDPADGLTAKDLVFAYGFRNPFGGAWRDADGSLWEVENGPFTDRLARVVAGRNYLWDGTNESMFSSAAYAWTPSHAPVNLAFTQPSTFAGSGFPAGHSGRAWVTESGPTYAPGPQTFGKRIVEIEIDDAGAVVGQARPIVEYVGAGFGTAVALAAGPDGLYFSDLYKNFAAASPAERGASVFRISWTGTADFTAEMDAGAAPFEVQFRDASDVPSATAWRWEFGDGASSGEREPVHVYRTAGAFDVRLTVTGPAGEVSRQKPAFVTVEPAGRARQAPPRPPRPTPRAVPPR